MGALKNKNKGQVSTQYSIEMNNILSIIQIVGWFVILVLGLTSCSSDEFKKNSLSSSEIICQAIQLEETISVEDLDVVGERVARVNLNKEKSKKYLLGKQKILKESYNKIRPFAELINSENYHEALFLCALINQYLFYYSGDSLEDSGFFVEKIKKIDKFDIEDWVLDKFYGHLHPEEVFKYWIKKDKKEKIDEIYDTIILFYGNELIVRGKYNEALLYYKQLELKKENTEVYKRYALDVIREKMQKAVR